MCKEWPGARCASHTGASYTASKDNTRKVARALLDAREALDSLLADDDASASEIAAARLAVTRLDEELADATDAQQKAKEVWASTPGGKSTLESEYARAIAESKDKEAEHLLETIKSGEEIRRYREEAQKIAASAFKNAQMTSDEVKEVIAAKQKELDENRSHLTEAHGDISERTSRLKNARKDEAVAHKQAKRSIEQVKSSQDRLRALITQAYVDAGVNDNLSSHYAIDSIASMDKGWEHLSATPGDKFPKYANQVDIKLKSSEPGTYIAARALAEDKKYQKAHASLVDSVNKYNHSVSVLKSARENVQAIDNDLYNSVKAVTPESSSVSKLQEEILELKAIHSSRLAEQETFSVDFGGFVKSGYQNPDGSSNAFVRLENVGGNMPGYVQVDKIIRDPKNPHVILKNGIKMTVDEMRKSSIKLTKPQKGARKFVG